MVRRLLIFTLFGFLFFLIQLNFNEKLLAGDVKLNSPAMDFTLPNIKGENFSLKQFKGKVVLLNFWATWCPPCRLEIPILNNIYKNYKKLGFEIIGISLDTDIERLKAFLKENTVNFLVLYDKKGTVGFKYKVEVVPTSFLLDKDHILRQIYIGIINEKQLVSELKIWLKK